MNRNSAVTGALSRELAEARLSQLYRDHAREILGYALRRSADSEDAADVLAETFLVAWRRLGEVPPGEEARLWLYGVARRVLANQHRGERRRTKLGQRLGETLRSELAAQPDPGGEGEGREVLHAMRGLGTEDRELFLLVVWEELSPSEAAKVLGISSLAARSRLHRARRRLRRLLEDAEGAGSPGPQLDTEEAG